MSCGVGYRCGSDLALLWLWYRPATTAPIQPLGCEPPHAAGVALKSKKKKSKHHSVCINAAALIGFRDGTGRWKGGMKEMTLGLGLEAQV